MVVIISCVFTGAASAETFYGKVYDNDGNPISGKKVVIQKSDGWGISAQAIEGNYEKSATIPTYRNDQYKMKIDGIEIETRELTSNDWKEEWHLDFNKGFWMDYSCNWDHNKPPTDHNQIPEFPAVALPVAAVIGIVFFFQQRKEKK